jgi:Ulp1 family protease
MHLNNNHWALSAVDVDNMTITYYDSLKISMIGADVLFEKLANVFSNYIRHKLQIENNRRWKYIVADNPKQKNGDDCGVFVCRFMEYLTRNERFDFEQCDMEYIRVLITIELLEGELLNKYY